MSRPSYLDGHLLRWVEHLGQVQRLGNCDVLSVHDEMRRLNDDITELVKSARKDGCNWLWTYDDITKDKDEEGSIAFTLSTVSIASHLNLRSNSDLPAYFKKHKPGIHVLWDTESGGWYPRFASRERAEQCIDAINDLFNRQYLKGPDRP